MSDAEDLDEALREKLRAAAELDRVPPRPEREAHLVRALQHELHAQRRSRRLGYGSVALAAAAALLLGWWMNRDANESSPRAAAPTAPCALPIAPQLSQDADGKWRLALGRFGTLVATSDAEVRVEKSEACELSLRLAHGELAGALARLKPALLRVHTEFGTVVVRGTEFSVRADTALQVVLLSGRVEIEERERENQLLAPEHVYERRGEERRTRALAAEERARVTSLLARTPRASAAPDPEAVPPPDVVEPSEVRLSASQLLARAESARQKGQLGRARALYEQASARAEADAEVALLRWVRLELAARAFGQAERLLQRHEARFSSGRLGAEAAWLGVVLQQDRGEHTRAQEAARRFLARYPRAPQADAARALLDAP